MTIPFQFIYGKCLGISQSVKFQTINHASLLNYLVSSWVRKPVVLEANQKNTFSSRMHCSFFPDPANVSTLEPLISRILNTPETSFAQLVIEHYCHRFASLHIF